MRPTDYSEFAIALDTIRELLRATVVGLMADGFSEEQARQIATHIITTPASEEEAY